MVLYYPISLISTNQQSTATTVDTSTKYFNNSPRYAIAQLYTSTQSYINATPYTSAQAVDTSAQAVDTSAQAVDTSVQPSAKFDVSVNDKNNINTPRQKISILSNMPEKNTIMDTTYGALSVDDKLNFLNNSLTSGLETVTIYFLICMALLVIIAIKLYR